MVQKRGLILVVKTIITRWKNLKLNGNALVVWNDKNDNNWLPRESSEVLFNSYVIESEVVW